MVLTTNRARGLPLASAVVCTLLLQACSGRPAADAGLRAAQVPQVPPPVLMARAAVALDLDTGAVLYAKQPDLVIPPASLTKLMTLHLAWKRVEENAVTLSDKVPVSVRAWGKNQPAGSSLMFLEPGQQVTLLDLMRGLALPSGNDAAVAVAEYLGGTVSAFVGLMNAEAARLGLRATRFADPSGFSEKNVTTASEYARFCRIYVQAHPDAVASLHALAEFDYPRPENLPPAVRGSRPTLTRQNHNELIGRVDGVQGLKTGYIDESGYNIALYAQRGGMRIVAVVLGGQGDTAREGGLNRAVDSTSLLTYAFYAWTTLTPQLPDLPQARVYGAPAGRVPVALEPPVVTVPREAAAFVTTRSVYGERLRAPLAAGAQLGSVVVSLRGKEILSVPLVTRRDVPRGSLARVVWDGASLLLGAR